MEPTSLLLAGGIVGAVAWVIALARGRVNGAEVGRGLLHGILVSAVLLAVTATIVAIFFTGREFLGGPVGLGEALGLGVLVGAVLGVGYFVAGAALMPIGLLVTKSRDWALYGTWVAVVVVVLSIGLGWTAYSAYLQEQPDAQRPTPAPTRPATTP